MRQSFRIAVAILIAGVACTSSAAKTSSQPPKLSGPYLRARETLRSLGYTPIKVQPPFASTCVDQKCSHTRHTSEGICAADRPLCVFYWRAPSGRYVRIDTVGEVNFGRVSKISWTTPAAFSELVTLTTQ